MANLTKAQVREIIAKAPPGTSPAGVVAALRAEGHTLEGFQEPAAGENTQTVPPGPGIGQQLIQAAVKSLPAVGATVGGVVGAPALAAGQVEIPAGLAMLGGAAGKGLEQMLRPAVGLQGPTDPLQTLQQQANAATLAGIGEGVPNQAVAPALKYVGTKFARSQMGKALAPARSLVRSFPDLISDALRTKTTVGSLGGKGGAAAADMARRAATGQVNALLRSATKRGISLDAEQIAQPVVQAMTKKLGRRLTMDEYGRTVGLVQGRIDDLMTQSVFGAARNGVVNRTMNPLEADELRKAAARAARATLNAEAAGLPTNAIPDLDRHIAKGAAAAVKTIAGVRAARATEQSAIGLARATREAELNPVPPMVSVGLGPLKAGFGMPPELASRLAINSMMLTNPAIGPILANILRGFGAGGAQLSQ